MQLTAIGRMKFECRGARFLNPFEYCGKEITNHRCYQDTRFWIK